MSDNCVMCIVNKRTETGLLCDDCRKEQKEIALKAVIASAFLHFKNSVTRTPCGIINPPKPEESKLAYQNDPFIHKFTDFLASAISKINRM